MGERLRGFLTRYWWQVEGVTFLLLSILWILPWGFSGKLYVGDDLAFHLNRIQGLTAAFKASGNWFQIPAVATGAFSAWGYPINLFYPATALIPAAWLQAVAPGIGGYYVFLVFLNFATLGIAAVVAYQLLQSRGQAFLVAVIYSFAQYRFLDFFVRGALAEGIVFTFLPIVFYGLYCLTVGDYRKWYWLAIGMALIALTHVISLALSAVGVVVMLSMWGLSRTEPWRRLRNLGFATVLAVGLSAGFLGPLAEQLVHVGKLGVAQYSLAQSAAQLGDLFSNSLDNATASNQINFGVVALLLTVAALFAWKQLTAFDRYCLGLSWFFIFLGTNLFPWQLFQGLLGNIQFPWRFLALAVFPLALVGARSLILLAHARTFNREFWTVAVASLAVVGIALGTSERLYHQVGLGQNKIVTNASYLQNATTDTTTDYVAQRGQVSMAAVRTHSVPVMNTQANGQQLTDLQQQTEQPLANGLSFHLTSAVPQRIKLPELAYAGYHVYVNGRQQTPTLDANGVVHIKVTAGASQVRYVYQPTVVQILSGWVAALSWLGLLGTLGWRRYHRSTSTVTKTL